MLPVRPLQRGAQKRKVAVFRIKIYFCGRKSVTTFLCANTVSDKVVMPLLACTNDSAQMIGRGHPLKRKFCA